MPNQFISNNLTNRIQSDSTNISEILEEVSSNYDLGEIVSAKGIEIGYEDVNIMLRTATGTYLVKIFGIFRSHNECVTYYKGMLALNNQGVPVPKLYAQKTGGYLLGTKARRSQPVHLIVMEYFEGKDFLAQPPSTQDVATLLSYLDKIHHTPYNAPEVYDPWEPQFLVGEFEKHHKLLSDADRKLVEPIVSIARTLDFKSFKKGLIHADLMRNNCIKNDQGQYCLLDFGVLSWNYIIIDIAIFIAGFCLDPLKTNKVENQKMYDFVAQAYKEFDAQPIDTANTLPQLIKMTYASYLIAALYEKADGNNSDENEYWIAMGRKGMKLCLDLQF